MSRGGTGANSRADFLTFSSACRRSGAVMSLFTGLQTSQKLEGLVILSGFLPIFDTIQSVSPVHASLESTKSSFRSFSNSHVVSLSLPSFLSPENPPLPPRLVLPRLPRPRDPRPSHLLRLRHQNTGLPRVESGGWRTWIEERHLEGDSRDGSFER